MAEDTTVESPSVEGGGESLEELRQRLADKQEELAGLRAEREQAQRAAVEKVEKEQLLAAISRVQSDIDAEQQQLDIQNALDPKQVGIGVTPEPAPPAPVDPEEISNPEGEPVLQTLKYGEVAQPSPPPVEDHSENETSEGDEN